MMRVNEIFYSLQGEGFYSGTPSVFIRFSGCNLRCPFCDTQHEAGEEMSEEEIVARVTTKEYGEVTHVVITGGEPGLQLTASLIDKLHAAGKYVAVETNGTIPLPANVDWITLSPKESYVKDAEVVITHADELKLIYDGVTLVAEKAGNCRPTLLYLQPMDTGNDTRNSLITAQTVDYIKRHPQWRLSLQIHKILNIQ